MSFETQKSDESPLQRFAEHYEGEIREISWDELPEAAQKIFVERSKDALHPKRWEPDFKYIWKIDHPNGDVCFVVENVKRHTGRDHSIEAVYRSVYLADFNDAVNIGIGTVSVCEQKIVQGELVANQDPFPYVDHIRIEDSFRGRDTDSGERHSFRLYRTMNAASHMVFNHPLVTSTYETEAGKRLTEALIKNDMVVQNERPGRYTLVTKRR